MINDEFNKSENKKNCNIHVMPPPISDDDINALFVGILSIMRRKFELETKAEIINSNANLERVIVELKQKQAECNRLKNEILHLKHELELTKKHNRQNLKKQ